ncbi:MAG: DEAD/DEAH box helicase, partial [Deltaproteobacteria bacterium]|nr:DEAD/DEAH box helicase [Deltaproteobacteria bacterium]
MTVNIHVDNAVRVLEADLPASVIPMIKRHLTLLNPQWQKVERYGRWKNTKSRYLTYYQRQSGVFILPRGYINGLLNLLVRYDHTIIDRTCKLPEIRFGFQGELYAFQQQALKDILSHRFGVLEAPPGSGKTIMAMAAIERRMQPTLVIVHSKELMYQWRERLEEFLELDRHEIGLIGDGNMKASPKITIGIINSLYKCKGELYNRIGHLIVDECHHVPAKTFTEVVSHFNSSYMLGLSATPYRSDNLTNIIYFYMGDKVHQINARQLQAIKKIMRARLEVRYTEFTYLNAAQDYQGMISALVEDERRNCLIVQDVVKHTGRGGIALVLSDRVAHCEQLYHMIAEHNNLKARLLTGSITMEARKEIVWELQQGGVEVLVATSRLIGEGFDLKTMSSIFLATPVKFTGRLKQYIGRILRVAEGKEEAIIYDYIDIPRVLRSSFLSRLVAYKSMGVEVPEHML